MTYQEELQAKLDTARLLSPVQEPNTLNTLALEEQLIKEIEAELELSQYDLDESDILRSIKILHIVNKYPKAFTNHKALSIFYALAKTDIIKANSLFKLSRIRADEFKKIINAMASYKLLIINEDKEIELTTEGMSLAERIGFDVFI